MKITYSKHGDYYLPNLTVSDKHYNIGKYGMLRRSFLKKHHNAIYSIMLMNGILLKHLAEVDKMCNKEIERLISDMGERDGITEALKATDQMKWVQRMNNIKHRAEEIIYSEIIYKIERGDLYDRK